MKVRIYAHRANRIKELDTLVLKHGQLVQEPKCIVLTKVLRDPLVVYEKGERFLIDAEEEPEKFLRSI